MKLIQNTDIQINSLVKGAPSGQVGKAVLGVGFAALAGASDALSFNFHVFQVLFCPGVQF